MPPGRVGKGSLAEKFKVVESLWPDSDLSLERFDERAYVWFFDYIDYCIKPFEERQHLFASKTFLELVELIQMWREDSSKPLSTVIRELSMRYLNFQEKTLTRSLELSVRVWLTINVNSPSLAISEIRPHEIPLQWSAELSLNSLIQDHFSTCQTYLQGNGPLRVEGTFTAAYLVNVCGLGLSWTDSLTDHLRVDPGRQALTVYKHKVCLVNHLKARNGCPIPRAVLLEALDTLNLLFPFGDSATRQLLIKENYQAFYRLGNCGRDRELDLSNYTYWRAELDDLVDAFQRPPRSWKQLATDRRNLMEWAAFWVTVMVAVLTFVSIPCNIIQATYSVKAYRATLVQGSSTP